MHFIERRRQTRVPDWHLEEAIRILRQIHEDGGDPLQEVSVDRITGVRNGSSFDRFCNARATDFHAGQRKEDKNSFCFVFVDLDGLKACNDEGGHQAGDKLLRRFGRHMKKIFGSRVGRIGGDEFGLLLDCPRCEVEEIMASIQKKMDSFQSPLNFSFGVCQYTEASSMRAVWELADERMYQQKERRHSALRIKARP